MRKLFLFFISLGLCVASVAQVARDAASILPKGFDPWNIQRQYDAAKLKDFVPDGARAGGTAAGKAKKALKRADADKIEAQDYFTVAQTFYDGPNFVYDGGQVNTYSVGVTVDGTKVTFSNMFNFADYVCSDPKPVEGTYDPVAKTVTIPTPASFDKGTQVGLIYNYYVGVLASGEVDKDGNMTPSEELVFNVEGDFDRIYTTQHFGVSQYMPDGSKSMGYFGVYRYWSMTLPKPGAKLLQLNDNIDFGEVFPDTPMPKYFKVINTGLDAADYVVTVDSDGDSFSASSVSGTVQGQSAAVLTFNFEAGAVGDYEGIATIEYEGGEPLLLLMNGKVKPVPDYSAIVKNGEFRFTTSLDFPFEIKDVNGMSVAHSTQGGKAGQAFIAVKTVVPEGQLGKLSWKGMFNNSGEWYKVQGGIFIDDMTTARYTYTGQNEDLSRTVELAPGEHNVKFQFNQDYYTGLPEDLMYIYDLDLQTEPLEADAAENITPETDFGNFLLDEGGLVTTEGTLKLINKGSNPLKVTAVASDSEDFSGERPDAEAATLEEIDIPVKLNSGTAGRKEGEITVSTNAGDFKFALKANIVARPDYSRIVTEGEEYITGYTYNEKHPFIVEDGVAYNLSSYVIDNEPVTSSFKVSYDIPEGKVGILSWDGHSWGMPKEEDMNYFAHDTSWILINWETALNGLTEQVAGDVDAGSASLNGQDYLICVPGKYSVEFQYAQRGDGIYFGKDRLEISNLKIHVIDFVENKAELLTPEAEFAPTYIGPQRYTTAKVQLKNLGSKALEVTEIAKSGPFYGIVPDKTAALNKTLDIELWFMPETEGEFSEDVTIKTTAGDFKVACHASTKSHEGIIYAGDFEDLAYGWSAVDRNNDGLTWDLGSNMWGDRPQYCHSGSECLASASNDSYYGAVSPDNWTMSPKIEIPADGATLNYYVSAFHPDRYAEKYSLYVIDDGETNIDAVAESTPVVSEEIDIPALLESDGYVNGWKLREVDLTPYAGKTVVLAFRHHGCTGQELLRLDDVFVYRKGYGTGISDAVSENGNVESTEIYSASGIKLNSLSKGVNVIRKRYEDGTVRSQKIVMK